MEIREAVDSAGLTGIHLGAAPKATWPPQSPSLTPHQGRKGSPLATGLPMAWPLFQRQHPRFPPLLGLEITLLQLF